MRNKARIVHIDSCLHYQLRHQGGKLVLLEYGTGDPDVDYDRCPEMEQRGPFLESEGRIIEEFVEDEEVEFIYSSFTSKITPLLAGDKIFCGDDLKYHLTGRNK